MIVANAVFATTGMNILTFILAAVLSLPKQFNKVYVGSVLAKDRDGNESKCLLLFCYSYFLTNIEISVYRIKIGL